MTAHRLQDWPERLHAYIAAVRRQPYHALRHNCAMFVRGALSAMTGHDPIATLGIALPQTASQMSDVLDRYGGVAGLADAYLGCRLPAALAARGDIVLKHGDGGNTLGVCVGDHALFLTADGLQSRHLTECIASWRVE